MPETEIPPVLRGDYYSLFVEKNHIRMAQKTTFFSFCGEKKPEMLAKKRVAVKEKTQAFSKNEQRGVAYFKAAFHIVKGKERRA